MSRFKILVLSCLVLASQTTFVYATPSSVDYMGESVVEVLGTSVQPVQTEEKAQGIIEQHSKHDNYEVKRAENSEGKFRKKLNEAGASKQKKDNSLRWTLPVGYQMISIFGKTVVPEKQAVTFLKTMAPNLKIKVSAEEIVRYYYEESVREGVRADLALCQALLETGFFQFGGTVKATQNNFCGLGTTGKSVRGAEFKTPRIGVQAHIQHLLAYATEKKPSVEIVDPRYDLVQRMRKQSGYLTTWYSLNGNWAAGANYSEKIFMMHSKMLNTKF